MNKFTCLIANIFSGTSYDWANISDLFLLKYNKDFTRIFDVKFEMN